MKLTTITIGISRTVSLPGYENVKPSITVTAELEPDDKRDAVINHLESICRIYVNEQIDDALEAAGQNPRYYCGTLYTAHRWQQAHAIVVLTEEVEINALPGDWHSITPNPVRKETALERARRAAKSLNWDLWNWGSLGHDKALEWWNARTWYVAYRLDRWLDHNEHAPAKVVILPADENWDVTDRLISMRDDNGLSYRPRQLEEILKLIPPLPWVVADTEDQLRTILDEWQAANPRPPPPGTAGPVRAEALRAKPQSSQIDYQSDDEPDDESDDDEHDWDPEPDTEYKG